uniref:Aminopeptidase n=1 Tax=Ciona savignyi TaxID=51511 RepID=H2YEN6_CIOSA
DTTSPDTTVSATTGDTGQPSGPWTSIRLPPYLVPTHYVVDLRPVLEPDSTGKYWFNGTSEAKFIVAQPTNYIYIHSNKLSYSKVEVRDSSNAVVPKTAHWLYDVNQYLVVELVEQMVGGGEYSLLTEFQGELADDLGGLYRSSYINSAGNQVVIATTQMQPTDARKAFPCFDEPALKATFDISLSHKPPYFALSNTPNNPPIPPQTPAGEYTKTKFKRTVKMSTYLLAFVVCDFDFVESQTTSGTQTRIYARPQQIAAGNANYSAGITPKILEYFEGYFNVSYPLAKSGDKEFIHLLYHLCFHSWSNYQQFLFLYSILPQPILHMDQFVVSDLQRALNVDGLVSSRPIVAENVNTPSDINALFDTISYSKGACIIRMINQFAGEAAFKLGLENYLKEYAYGPVNHTQLFAFWSDAIDTTGGQNPTNSFATAMQSWTLQMGNPVVTLTRGGSGVVATQQRFLLDPNADKSQPPSPFGYIWTVPLWYSTQSDPSVKLTWMYPNQDTTLTGVASSDYIIGNYGGFGYYLVNYDNDNWMKIIDQLNNDYTKIEAKTRGQLIYDSFSLARAGELHYNISLSLTEFLKSDFYYVPWESGLDSLGYLDQMLGRSKVYGVYSSYLLSLVEPLYQNVTWVDGGSHLDQYQRVNAIWTACSYGHLDCITNAMTQFNQWKTTGNNNITANLRTSVYCNAVRYGGSDNWDFLWGKYQVESNSQEKAKLEYGLSCTRSPWVVRRFLDFIVANDSAVRKQDASSVFQDLCYNEYARDITWDFLRGNWDFIYGVYGTGFFSFSGIISSCTSHFSTQFELQELEAFKAENADQLGSGVSSVDQALEKTKTNIQWRADYEDIVFAWLSDRVVSP